MANAMILTLKILHFLAFSAGIGGALANLVILRAARSSPADQAPALRALMPRIGMLSVHALVLLWITGPLLLWLAYAGGAGLGAWFHLKLGFAVLLTLVAGASRWTVVRMRAGKPAPLSAHMPRLIFAAALFGPLTLLFAVLAFS